MTPEVVPEWLQIIPQMAPKSFQNRSKMISFLGSHLETAKKRIINTFGIPLWALLLVETGLKIPLGAAKSRSRDFFCGPRAVQERSKRPPRPLQEAFSRPRSSKRPLGSHFGPIWTPFWTRFGRINHLQKVFRRQPAAIADIIEETRHDRPKTGGGG